MADAINRSPQLQDELFEDEEFIRYFAKLNHLLRADLKERALVLAKHLILKVANQLAGSGAVCGPLQLQRGVLSDEIDLDETVENMMTAPLEDLESNLATWSRDRERPAFVMMFDHSYSMRGPKTVLAALTVATIAVHFREHYAVVAFSTDVEAVKPLEESIAYGTVLDRVFDLPIHGLTNITGALEAGLEQLRGCNRTFGLLLTDGSWTIGEEPFEAAARFDNLNLIAFPPADPETVRLLAEAGHGKSYFVENEDAITRAIVGALQR